MSTTLPTAAPGAAATASAAAPAAAPAPSLPLSRYRDLLQEVDNCIPSDSQVIARKVSDYLGPSILYTLSSPILQTLVDKPERLYRPFEGAGDWKVGMNRTLYECRCKEWGRIKFSPDHIPRRGIFESLFVNQIVSHFPNRNEELHLCIIAAAGNFQTLRLLALLVIVAHYTKIRVTLVDYQFELSACPHRCPCKVKKFTQALDDFIQTEFVNADPFGMVDIKLCLSDKDDRTVMRTLNAPGCIPPQVMMMYDFGARDGRDDLSPMRDVLVKLALHHKRPDTLVTFSFFPTLYFGRFDRLHELNLDGEGEAEDVVILDGEDNYYTPTLEELEGPVAQALTAQRITIQAD